MDIFLIVEVINIKGDIKKKKKEEKEKKKTITPN